MKLTPPDISKVPESGLFNESEKKRMKVLIITFSLALIVFLVLIDKQRDANREAAQRAAEGDVERAPAVVTLVPEIDVEALREQALDARVEDRVLIEPQALAGAFRDSILINDQLFEPMQGALLDAGASATLLASSNESRGRLFRAYGRVEAVRRLAEAGPLAAHTRGRLQLEDGSRVYFAVLNEPAYALMTDDFVRVDGIFVKNLRREGEGSEGWIEAPLLAGPRAIKAYPKLAAVTELDPAIFADIVDDSIEGISGKPFDPYWSLVSYVQNLPEGAVDWADTPVLEKDVMHELATDGARFRAAAVRLPVSQVMELWSQAQKENPLRIAYLTEGWIGNEKWFGPTNGVIRFVTPGRLDHVRNKDNVLASGFFLKHLAYEPRDGGVAVAPLLVLHSVEVFTSVPDTAWQMVLAGFGVLIVGLTVAIYLLLRRDRRRSAELQAELRARRRARQSAAATP